MTTKTMHQVPRQMLVQQQMQAQMPGEAHQPPPNGVPFSAAPPLPPQVPVAPPAPPSPPAEDPRFIREREQREAAQRTANEERVAREKLEAELTRRDEEQRRQTLASLPPEQQVASRLSEVERALAQERTNFQVFQRQQADERRAQHLALYRERAVRDVPSQVSHLVYGNTELEIDAAVDNAIKTFRDLEANIRAQVEAEAQQRMAASYPSGFQPLPIPPPNPHYTPAYTAHPGAAGFPTVVNPAPMVQQEQGVVGMELRDMTSEQAVRSGRYSGELRQQVHANLRRSVGQAYPGAMGAAPRHWNQPQVAQPQQYVQQPGGVMQPQGIPTPAVQNPHYQQHQPQPQYVQQQPQQMMVQQQPQPLMHAPPQQMNTGLPMMPMSIMQQPTQQPTMGSSNAAADAIARLHNGQNPVLGDPANLGAAQQLADANQFAQQRGIASPQDAFSRRFSQG